MKFLITGGSGQLGFDIKRELVNRYDDVEVLTPNHEELDITNHDATIKYILEHNPNVIFHCAAYTKVDQAEEDCKTCYDVNVNGTKNIRDGASLVDAKLIYVSTDYVFDGTKEGLYKTTDEVNPINFYGQTKLLGEQIALEYPKTFVARTSWVFGINGNNFIKTMLRLAETHDFLTVVGDQFGSPTYTVDLAHTLVEMSETEKYNIYHTNNDGYTNWYEFAKYALEKMGYTTEVRKIKTEDYKTKAARPMNSCLDRECLSVNGFEILPHWKDAVDRFCQELINEKKTTKILERSDNNGRN